MPGSNVVVVFVVVDQARLFLSRPWSNAHSPQLYNVTTIPTIGTRHGRMGNGLLAASI
jgi:hypothetical protein